MTRQQAGVSAEAVAKLVAEWRTRAVNCDAGILARKHIEGCANELYAALATAPPEQAAKKVEVCGLCGGFLEGDYCPACDVTVDEDARDTVPAQPQPVSAGALREVLESGLELVESAFAHVSHGGPTRADAEKWIKEAKDVLSQ